MSTESPVLLYDGECGFCAGSVQFMLQREPPNRRSQLRFAPLQGVLGATVRSLHPETADIDSIVWFERPSTGHTQVRVRSAAALAALAHLGGGYRLLARLGWLVPRPIRDAVYNAVAQRRLALAAPACLVPTAEQRTRFLA